MPQNKKAITVSLIIPVYNEARHLKACLDLVAQQTIMPDEVIVVDNNSTDDSVAIASSYPFVRIITEPMQGIVFARNAGFNAATGDIIARIDADTHLPPGWVQYIKRFYAHSAHHKSALTGGATFYNIRFPRANRWLLGQIAFRMNRLLMGHYITYGANMALPTKIWHAVKGSTCIKTDIHEDLDLSIHLHRSGYHIIYREALRVGVKMRRARSNRSELWENLQWWPRTLRHHGKKTWIFGFIGASVMYLGSPIIPLVESTARVLGFQPLDE